MYSKLSINNIDILDYPSKIIITDSDHDDYCVFLLLSLCGPPPSTVLHLSVKRMKVRRLMKCTGIQTRQILFMT